MFRYPATLLHNQGLVSSHVHVFGIAESRLNESDIDTSHQIDGFKQIRNDQTTNAQGKRPPHGMATYINLLPNDKILDWSKLKQIADDILKCI